MLGRVLEAWSRSLGIERVVEVWRIDQRQRCGRSVEGESPNADGMAESKFLS